LYFLCRGNSKRAWRNWYSKRTFFKT